jgi:hypothetical protein
MLELKVNLFKGRDTAGSLPSTNNDAKEFDMFPCPIFGIKIGSTATVEK